MSLITPVVSVVVPIYKVERYLAQCVDSILAQTLREIEVILVDDGSPDACPAMCDAYAARDSRVRVIHQENGGYGKAVNVGIAVATAPYIGIVESDDWIEPTMYEKLHRRAEETGADVVKCMFWKYDSTKPEAEQNKLWHSRIQDLNAAPDEPFSPVDWQPVFYYHASLWSNLYKSELIRQISFSETPGSAYQDFPFIMEVYASADTISIVKEALYHYRMETMQESSSTTRDHRLMRMADMSAAARDVLQRNNLLQCVKEAFYFHVYMANSGYIDLIQPEFKQQYFNKVHHLLAPLLSDASFVWKYFPKKHRKRAQIIARGGNVNQLNRNWLFAWKNGHLHVRIAGVDILR